MSASASKIGRFSGLAFKIQLTVGLLFLLFMIPLGLIIYFTLDRDLKSQYDAELTRTTGMIWELSDVYVNTAIRNYLRGKADQSYEMVKYYYKLYEEGKLTEKKAYAEAKAMLLDPEYGKIGKTGYLAGVNSKGVLVIHPHSEGVDASGFDFMKKATAMKNGYIEYMWKNKGEEKAREKAGAMAYFAPWDLIIWASSYKSEFSSLINLDTLRKRITSAQLGKTGAVYIIDDTGKIIIHSDKNMIGKNLGSLQDKSGSYFIKDIINKAVEEYTRSAENGSADDTSSGAEETESSHGVLKAVYPGLGSASGNTRGKMVFFKYLPMMKWVVLSDISIQEVYDLLHRIRNIIIIISAAAFILVNLIISFAFRKLLKPIGLMREVSNAVGGGDLTRRITIQSKDEIAEMSRQFNRLVDNFEIVLKRVKENVKVLLDSVQDLSVSSQEISSTSNEQAAAVKEIVSTMEDSDQLAKSIATRIHEVTSIAHKTKDVVDEGFETIKQSMGKMDEIKNSNSATIAGIRSLGEKIESIWDIVSIINDIADQTKIIAFNAELEAAAAGEAGKNFQIVAAEIRRLADSTVNSTNEIKTKINEIQHSSDNLIIASEEGTEKITTGWELSNNQRKLFEDIRSSAEISAKSAEQIALSINQQVSAFEQILQTLKQISEGIDNFVVSTKSTTGATENLKNMADTLHSIINTYAVTGDRR